MTSNYKRTSSRSTLTDSDVLDIRRQSTTSSERQLAEQYGIHKKTVHNIIHNNTWTHVPNPKTIPSFKDYVVYPDGRVLAKRTNKFITPITRTSGKVVVRLNDGNSRRYVPVATLVAKAFLGTRKRNLTVTFEDGNPSNTHFSNLSV